MTTSGGFSTAPLRRIATITLGKMLKAAPGEGDVALPYLRAAHVQPHGLHLVDIKEMWFSPQEAAQLTLHADDVVVVEGGAGFGRSAHLAMGLAGWGFQNSVNRVRPREGFDGRFIAYALKAAQSAGQLDLLINRATIPHLTAEKLALVEVPVTDCSQQRKIADYLDRETAEIDAFIADQKRLIELLTERRTAVIDGAIDNMAAASGPLGAALTLAQTGPFGSQLGSDDYVEGGVPVINPAHITEAGISPDLGVSISPERFRALQRHELLPGDVIAARRGELGRCAVIDERCHRSICGTGSILLRPNPAKIQAEYLALVLRSSAIRDQLRLASVGSTMENVSTSTLTRLRIPLPRVVDQRSVVKEVVAEQKIINAAIADAREAIALSKERRAALVSAAVTGKIDVTT